jgi:N-acetylmuramoyl-L-alanine amidase
MQAYRLGDRGPAVAEIRSKLTVLGVLAAGEGPPDGTDPAHDTFDEECDRAVRGFQQSRGLTVDGIVGRETYVALDEARWRLGDRLLSYTVSRPFVGDDVVELQRRLLDMGFDCGRADGIFGANTQAALQEFQRNVGLIPDGTCGPMTLKMLHRLVPRASGGQPEELRESERLHYGGPAVTGKLVIVDPGHGGRDRGVVAGDLEEASIVEDIASKVEGRLSAVGGQAFLTRGPDADMSDADRVGFANAAEADIVISLHVDGDVNPDCNGVACYYFGTAPDPDGRSRRSALGAALADLIQREIVARTDLRDCRVHPKTWELLRGTRMPAVRVEVGYLTNEHDAARLASPQFRDAVAEAIVAGVQRLYLPVEADVTTGSMPIPALR